MAGRKAVTPGHVVENSMAPADENTTVLDGLQDPNSAYQPDMAPVAAQENPETIPKVPQTSPDDSDSAGPDTNTPDGPEAPEDESELLCLVILRNGASFWHKGRVFKNGEPNAVDEETAERLVSSGYFERG